MSQNICNTCHKDLKYLSLLRRHQNKKKQCSLVIINSENNQHQNDNEHREYNNLFTIFQDNIKHAITLQDKKQCFTDFITFFNKKNNIQNTHVQNENIQNICIKCNAHFSSRQGLHRHIKNNTCTKHNLVTSLPTSNTSANNNTSANSNPTPSFTFNDIINSDLTINADNNTTNNITNNNITNNNITINVNPFKCESLEHITLANFKTIYKSINNIDNLLCYFIYKRNLNNVSFFKNNINQNIVSVLNNKMEIEKMTDDQFIKEIKYNINDSKIELFFNFKDDLSQHELIKYMHNMIIYHNNLINNQYATKNFNDILKTILDTSFRDKDQKNLINSIIKQLKQDCQTKLFLQQHNYNIIKTKLNKLKNYYEQPLNNNDAKNLYIIKNNINDAINQTQRIRDEASN